MAGRSQAASSKRLVRASSTMKTVGSLASIASDIAIILCIVGLCNLIGSNPCPASSHWSLAVKNGVDWEKLVGTLRAHTHKTTQNTPHVDVDCRGHRPLCRFGGDGSCNGYRRSGRTTRSVARWSQRTSRRCRLLSLTRLLVFPEHPIHPIHLSAPPPL